MDLEDYIKDLDPDLQEKARACGSIEELVALAKDAKVPVPDEALAAIAGGDDVDHFRCFTNECPNCGHWEKPYWVEELSGHVVREHYKCSKCGYKWYEDY